MSFSTELSLNPLPIRFNINNTSPNGEWIITGTDVKKEACQMISTRADDSGKISDILSFILELKRRPHYVTQNIIFPTYLTSGLSLVVFLIPPSSGERVSVSLSVLVAFTVFMLITVQSIPRTSTLPVLTSYLAYELVNIASSVIISTLVVNLHYRKSKEMHWIFKKVILIHNKISIWWKRCRRKNVINNEHYIDHEGTKEITNNAPNSDHANRRNQGPTLPVKCMDQNQWQTLAHILNQWLMIIYFISNLVAFFGYWGKVYRHY